MSMAGIDAHKDVGGIDGRSFLPLLISPAASPTELPESVAQYMSSHTQAAVKASWRKHLFIEYCEYNARSTLSLLSSAARL